MLHLGLPWDSSHKIFKHCTKTYVKTGLGNLVCPSHELSKVEQNLVEVWDLSSGLLVFTTACHYCRKLNSHELNRFVFKKKKLLSYPFLVDLKFVSGNLLPGYPCFFFPKLCSTNSKQLTLLHPGTSAVEHLIGNIRFDQSFLFDPIFTSCTL